MITSFRALKGFAADLPLLKGKSFRFKPGLNIIFGPNGCGKTTMLKIMAGYCAVKGGGWSRFPKYMDVSHFGDKKKKTYPSCLAMMTPGNCSARVNWDGSPSFLFSADVTEAARYHRELFDLEDSPDGVTDTMEQVGIIAGHPSAGVLRQHKFAQMYKLLKTPPVINKLPANFRGYSDDPAHGFVAYINRLKQKGPITVFMDEPDRSLSIDILVALYDRTLPGWATKFQLIIATHCPVVALSPRLNANIIDLQPGYLETSKKWLNGLIANEDLWTDFNKA